MPSHPAVLMPRSLSRDRYGLQSHARNTKPSCAQGDLICFHARHVWQAWKEPQVSEYCHTFSLREQLRTMHCVDFRLNNRGCAQVSASRCFAPHGTEQKSRRYSKRNSHCQLSPPIERPRVPMTQPCSTIATAAASQPTKISSTV